jgi:hypothetical protein
MRTSYSSRRSSGIAALVFLGACGSDRKEITQYLAQVAFAMQGDLYDTQYATATHRMGEPPPINNNLTRFSVSSLGGTYIPGGSTPLSIDLSGYRWRTGVIKVSGADGYFELSRHGNSIVGGRLVLTISQESPSAFVLQTGSPGDPLNDLPISLERVGTGDIQVNVSWDENSAIDLHVVEPSGNEIYRANKGPSATGGQLELGREVDCAAQGLRTENIYWPSDRAPRGNYTVRVDYPSACGNETQYAVTVNVTGQQPQVFYGSFAPADVDRGGPGSGRTITTFSY